MRCRRAAQVILVALSAVVSPLFAQVSPHGGEFQVNSYTTSAQDMPRISSGALGSFVVVWRSYGSGGNDTDGSSIQAQRFAVSGAPLGAQFQVNTYTTSYQWKPAVASDPQGNFVVVWGSGGSSGNDASLGSIQAQRYAANGSPRGAQFQVNTYTTNSQSAAAVATDSLGNFVVVWVSFGSFGSDTSYESIQARLFAADGTPLTAQFQANSYTWGTQFPTTVGADSAGNFVVVWQSALSGGTDTSGSSILAQRFAANGAFLGGEFQVNSYTTNAQSDPSVAVDPAGSFVVVWDSQGSSGSDQLGLSIQGQRYAANGSALGAEIQVNSYTTNLQSEPSVARDARGDFVVVWRSNGSGGTDTSADAVLGQRFTAGGAPLGGEFQVNTYTTNAQSQPAVARAASGDFVVTWQSDGSSGSDHENPSIQGQRFDGLFRDGFESGGSDRWSSTTP